MRRMWTSIKTIVDGNTVPHDWTVCRDGVPVGRVYYSKQDAGVGSWFWEVWNSPGASGQAWTEEAAINAVKENVSRDEAEPA